MPYLLSPFFLLREKAELPAAVVFPVYSAGSVAVIVNSALLLKWRKKK